MTQKQVRVTFQPSGRTVFVLPGTKLLEAAGRAGLALQTPCGGRGTCGKCRVRVARGAAEPTPPERDALGADELNAGWRLACQAAAGETSVVHVPETSLFAGPDRILTADRTAALADYRPRDFEPSDTTAACFGAAFDVGTTTLVGSLVDLVGGGETAVAAAVNPQVSFGDDVLARIGHAGAGAEQLEALRGAVVSAVNKLLDELCGAAGVARERVCELAFAGNTTMQHLLCGIDPSPLGRVPFVPVRVEALVLPADELGVAAHPRAAAYVFPVIGGFVGGDAVAGVLATGLADQDAPVMMVDIGTNGEIVLAAGGQVWAASTAAGPAFEGARISCGMRAAPGAIEKVVFDGDVRFSVIGGAAAAGLCGSALVDLAAELLRSGLLTPAGRLLGPDELPASVPAALRRRVSVGPDGRVEFFLTAGGRGAAAVAVTGRDVRELQLAAGAIRTGVGILLRRAGVPAGELAGVYLAGAFGSFIRRSNAQRLGLLPAQIAHERIHYVGNTSLSGARWALVSDRARERAEQIARTARHVELNREADFQERFAEALIFPADEPAQPKNGTDHRDTAD